MFVYLSIKSLFIKIYTIWFVEPSKFYIIICKLTFTILSNIKAQNVHKCYMYKNGFLATSSHSTCCRLVSVSLFFALVCLGPRVILLVVDLSPS